MMYYLNKFVGFVISPIGIAILGGLGALLCARFKRQRVAKWIGGLTVAWLWLWMTPIMSFVVGVPLEREFLVDGRVPPVESFPEADAIVLLGGSMGIETNLSSYAEMWTSADRVWQAARLYKAGKAPKVIATGDGARDSTLTLLKDFGVAEECILFHDARNTEEEARRVGELVSGGVGELVSGKSARATILLVTSAWHMKRARMMFEKYAPEIEVVCAPADFENSMTSVQAISIWDFIPSPAVLSANSTAFHEWLGILGYKILR